MIKAAIFDFDGTLANTLPDWHTSVNLMRACLGYEPIAEKEVLGAVYNAGFIRLCLPDDFDERFYNSAHPDMIYTGFLSGDENISLEGFFKFEQVVKTKLPGIRPVLILKTKHNTSHMFLPVADTMVIDLSRQEIYLTWRLTIPDFFGMKEGVLSCIIPECIGKKYYG